MYSLFKYFRLCKRSVWIETFIKVWYRAVTVFATLQFFFLVINPIGMIWPFSVDSCVELVFLVSEFRKWGVAYVILLVSKNFLQHGCTVVMMNAVQFSPSSVCEKVARCRGSLSSVRWRFYVRYGSQWKGPDVKITSPPGNSINTHCKQLTIKTRF